MSTSEQIQHAEETKRLIEEGQFESKEIPEEVAAVIGAEPVSFGVHALPSVKHVNQGPVVGNFAKSYESSFPSAPSPSEGDEDTAAASAPAQEAEAGEPASPVVVPADSDVPSLDTLTVDDGPVASDVGTSNIPVVDAESKADVGITTEGPATVVEVVDSAQAPAADSTEDH